MNYQVGLSVLHHSAKSTPTTCPPHRTPTPATTMVMPSLFRMKRQWLTMLQHYPPWHHPLALAQHHSLPMVPPLRVPRVGLPAPALSPAPTSLACPPPLSGCLWAEHSTPEPHWTPDLAQARSTHLHYPSSAAALVVTGARAAARRPYNHLDGSGLETFTRCPEHGGGS